ncbi:helix-turn-helix domain-containing protein [Enterococcus gallinarum]|uniref:helix-turn-helix domain-containing protein n=1 Tax=Enterococcus gallinarum TaxID=1353 RepID=UPI001D1798B1|nr:helix-turn-helix domain-containing protein [Enterococcus gallinarum]MCC4043717.1 helix-turn-helix domain-containing protein [Enterococcus gallinarum]
MQTFLTKTSLKKVILLDYLLEKNTPCEMKELKNILHVTDRSILNYIDELTGLFKRYDGKIWLLNDNNKRFQIQKEEDFPIYTIYLHFYKASYNYHLIQFMYNHPEKTLKDFAEKQFTSVSTVLRYAKLLEQYFNRYRIHFHPYRLQLTADERNIRCFFYYFYWNATRESDDKWPFQIKFSKIEHLIHSFEKNYQITLEPLQTRIFSYWLAINLERSQIKKVIVTLDDQSVIKADPNFVRLQKWNNQTGLFFEEDELFFLYQVIYSFGIIDGNSQYENSYATAHREHQTSSYRVVQHLTEVLKEMFKFTLAIYDPELMFNFIAFHERSSFFYGNTDLFFNRSYIDEVREESPKKYRIIEEFHHRLTDTTDKEVAQILENWEQLFLNYYFILDYYDLFSFYIDPVKILVHDDLHHTHRLWLMNKINALFGHSYTFAFYDYQTNIEDVDLVISNYYFNTGEVPLILMKNIPTERNWHQLGEVLYQLTTIKASLR